MEIPLSNDEIFRKLEAMKYPDDCKHLVRKYYNAEVHSQLRDKRTALGGTVGHCIYNGVKEPTASIAFLACDPEAYSLFSPLTDKIIRDYHKIPAGREISHPPRNLGDETDLPFGDLDPTGKLVVSTRVRVARTARGYPWSPLISTTQRNEIEERAMAAFTSLPAEYAGKYHPLLGMSEAERRQLVEDHFLFTDDDKYNAAAGVYRDWPDGRGIFFNDEKTFLVWVNEEDHLRLISMETGGDLARTYGRLVKAIKLIEEQIPFARSERLGNLTFCPTNLGTSLRASVHAKIPKLASNKELFASLCDRYGIQARGIHGEHTESVGGVYDLSNKRRLGISELAVVKEMADGVTAILAMEASL